MDVANSELLCNAAVSQPSIIENEPCLASATPLRTETASRVFKL